ncbi:MAG: VanZ family protein [Thermodesulfobacteriota bacterium]
MTKSSSTATGSERDRDAARYRWVTVLLYMGVIFILSSLSVPDGVKVPGLDKLVHVAAYWVMGFLCVRAIGYGGGRPVGRVVLAGFVLSVSFGALVELWQGFLPGRHLSPFDAAANGVGGFLGARMHKRLSGPGN